MTTAQKPITEARLDAAVHEILEDIRELDKRVTVRLESVENAIKGLTVEIRNGRP